MKLKIFPHLCKLEKKNIDKEHSQFEGFREHWKNAIDGGGCTLFATLVSATQSGNTIQDTKKMQLRKHALMRNLCAALSAVRYFTVHICCVSGSDRVINAWRRALLCDIRQSVTAAEYVVPKRVRTSPATVTWFGWAANKGWGAPSRLNILP